MKRSSERIIDAIVLAMLLVFVLLMRHDQPGLAGVVVASALKFWMDKNATEPTSQEKILEAAAKAAAEALLRSEERENLRTNEPRDVEIVGQSDTVEVDVVEKKT